jgi:hypothetical protein
MFSYDVRSWKQVLHEKEQVREWNNVPRDFCGGSTKNQSHRRIQQIANRQIANPIVISWESQRFG